MRSHAVGSGPPLPGEVVRGMLLLLGVVAAARALGRARGGRRAACSALLERDVHAGRPEQGLGRLVAATSRRSPTSALVLIGEGEATHRRRAAAAAPRRCARAGPRAGRARRQGGARADQRHAPDGRRRRRWRCATRGGCSTRRSSPSRSSLEAFKGSTVPFDARLHELRPQPRPAAGRGAPARAARRQPGGRPATPTAAACRTRTRCAARRRCSARSPTRSPTSRARSSASCRRSPTTRWCSPPTATILSRRQLPRAAAVAAARPPRARRVRAGRRSASGARSPCSPPATPSCRRSSRPRPGLSSGLMIAQYAAAALVNECQVLAHPGGRGLDPDLGRAGGLQLDGRAGRAEGAHRGGERRARDRHRAGVRVPGAGVPPPAAHARRCSRRRSRACARACRDWRRTDRWRRSSPSWPTRAAHRGGGAGVRCKGWQQEAALLMLENNLHPDVAEQPAGPGRLRRDRQGRAQPRVAATRSSASCSALERRRDAARAVGQAGRRCSRPTPTRRAC